MGVLPAATITDGNKEVGDSVMSTIDGDICRSQAPPISSVHIRSLSDAGLHGSEIVGLDSLK
jgi:hypothetical protein